jgi:hypothetical protein
MIAEIWRWTDRDLYASRPISTTLFLVPIIPALIGQEVGVAPQVQDILLWCGLPLSLAWFAYVVWRLGKNLVRSLGRTAKSFQSVASGDEMPTSCPVCDEELPEFVPADDGHVYSFRGWTCSRCGAELDERGQQI